MDGTDRVLNILNINHTATFFASAVNPIAVGTNRDTIFINLKSDAITTNAAADAASLYVADHAGAGTACLHIRNEENDVIKLFKAAVITTGLTTITYTAPGAPDYAIADTVDSAVGSAWGFSTHDEANTVLSIIKNLQDRVNELESLLQANGLGT